jgi:hypothetical protein
MLLLAGGTERALTGQWHAALMHHRKHLGSQAFERKESILQHLDAREDIRTAYTEESVRLKKRA